jgi:predicted nucleotidyltransferase
MGNLATHGLGVCFAVVFGSQTTGKADRWSDIDLLVVSPRFDALRNRQDIGLLWRVAARTDSRLEPIPCGERQWREDRVSPIVEIARREGQVIAA